MAVLLHFISLTPRYITNVIGKATLNEGQCSSHKPAAIYCRFIRTSTRSV